MNTNICQKLDAAFQEDEVENVLLLKVFLTRSMREGYSLSPLQFTIVTHPL